MWQLKLCQKTEMQYLLNFEARNFRRRPTSALEKNFRKTNLEKYQKNKNINIYLKWWG